MNKIEYINELINNEGLDQDGKAIKEVLSVCVDRIDLRLFGGIEYSDLNVKNDLQTIKIVRGYLDSLALSKHWSPEGDIASDIIDHFELDRFKCISDIR